MLIAGKGTQVGHKTYWCLTMLVFVVNARCVLQMGGSDQWGNMVNGVDLGRRVEKAELFALTAPLITTSEGKKMGKSASGAVWLNADKLPEYDYWQVHKHTRDCVSMARNRSRQRSCVLVPNGLFTVGLWISEVEMMRICAVTGVATTSAHTKFNADPFATRKSAVVELLRTSCAEVRSGKFSNSSSSALVSLELLADFDRRLPTSISLPKTVYATTLSQHGSCIGLAVIACQQRSCTSPPNVTVLAQHRRR